MEYAVTNHLRKWVKRAYRLVSNPPMFVTLWEMGEYRKSLRECRRAIPETPVMMRIHDAIGDAYIRTW